VCLQSVVVGARNMGEPETGDDPVNRRPGERPSQDGSGRYPSGARTAKRRDGARHHRFERTQERVARLSGASTPASRRLLIICTVVYRVTAFGDEKRALIGHEHGSVRLLAGGLDRDDTLVGS